MRKKRIFLTLSSAFLLFGATMNIMNAINNYGLATNSLHSEILAQTNGDDDNPGNGDNTGGGGTTTGGDVIIKPKPDGTNGEHEVSEMMTPTTVTNKDGDIIYDKEVVATGYESNTTYIISVLHTYCESDNSNGKCSTRGHVFRFLTVLGKVSSNTGTGTGNGDEPTVPSNP